MIYSLRGTIISCTEQSVVLSAHAVAFTVGVPTAAGLVVGNEHTLYTHMHWNQEQGPTLYGFNAVEERDLFVLIIGCSGMGPKIGLQCIRELGVLAFVHTIQTSDFKALSKVPGIGLKKAEQLVLHLRDKVAHFLLTSNAASTKPQAQTLILVQDALLSLEYAPKDVARVVATLNLQQPFDQMIRQALQALAK